MGAKGREQEGKPTESETEKIIIDAQYENAFAYRVRLDVCSPSGITIIDTAKNNKVYSQQRQKIYENRVY